MFGHNLRKSCQSRNVLCENSTDENHQICLHSLEIIRGWKDKLRGCLSKGWQLTSVRKLWCFGWTNTNRNAKHVDHHPMMGWTIVSHFLVSVNVVAPKLNHMPIPDPLRQWHHVLFAQFIINQMESIGVAETYIQVIKLTVHLYEVNKTCMLFQSFVTDRNNCFSQWQEYINTKTSDWTPHTWRFLSFKSTAAAAAIPG